MTAYRLTYGSPSDNAETNYESDECEVDQVKIITYDYLKNILIDKLVDQALIKKILHNIRNQDVTLQANAASYILLLCLEADVPFPFVIRFFVDIMVKIDDKMKFFSLINSHYQQDTATRFIEILKSYDPLVETKNTATIGFHKK